MQKTLRNETYEKKVKNQINVFKFDNHNKNGLTGLVVKKLCEEKKFEIEKLWGGSKGLNQKRMKQWKSSLELDNNINPGNDAFFLRLIVDGNEWAPFPEIPPIYQLINESNFLNYNNDNIDYYNYAKYLEKKNNEHLYNELLSCFKEFEIKFNAKYFRQERERIDLFIFNHTQNENYYFNKGLLEA